MTFRKLKKLSLEVGVEVYGLPHRAFGEWEVSFYCEEGKSFNGQYQGSVSTGDANLTLSEFCDKTWEFIKSEAEEITEETEE